MNLVTEGGIQWVSHDLLAVGDYGGAGSVGEANLRYLRCEFDFESAHLISSFINVDGNLEACPPESAATRVLILYESFGSVTAFLHPEIADRILESLENYPVLDDQILTEVETEWEKKAFGDGEEFEDFVSEARATVARSLTPNTRWYVYLEAASELDIRPEFQYTSAYIREEKIARRYWQILAPLLIWRLAGTTGRASFQRYERKRRNTRRQLKLQF